MGANDHLSPQQFSTLDDVKQAGYVTDEWKRWQQGDCYTYAHALQQVRPSLHLGTLDDGAHLFAHDSTHAYDSAGKHPLPYKGLAGNREPELHVPADYYDGPSAQAMPDAIAHIKRNRILD